MCLASFRFITLVKTSSAWVRHELDAHMDGILGIENRRTDLGGIYGCTVMLVHPFQKTRKYASRKKGLGKGDTETFEKRLYLHFYYNPIKKENDDAAFYGMVDGLKKQLEEGIPASSMAGTDQKKAAQYLSVRRKKVAVVFQSVIIQTPAGKRVGIMGILLWSRIMRKTGLRH